MNWLWLAGLLAGGWLAWEIGWEVYVTVRVSRATRSEDRSGMDRPH